MTPVIVNFVSDNATTISAAAALVLLLGAVAGTVIWDRRASIRKYLEHRREIRIQRGIEMGRKQKADREAYVLGLLGAIITNGLEEAWFAGDISPDERNWAYRKVAARGVPDMLPKRTQAQIKAMIKRRRYHGTPSPAQEHPAWGEASPRPTKNDQLVAQQVAGKEANVIQAGKRFGEKALNRIKKTA